MMNCFKYSLSLKSIKIFDDYFFKYSNSIRVIRKTLYDDDSFKKIVLSINTHQKMIHM